MKCSPFVRVVDAGPLQPDDWEMLKKVIKKVALRKLRHMRCEAKGKLHKKPAWSERFSNQPEIP
jgi:hypothetical protein